MLESHAAYSSFFRIASGHEANETIFRVDGLNDRRTALEVSADRDPGLKRKGGKAEK